MSDLPTPSQLIHLAFDEAGFYGVNYSTFEGDGQTLEQIAAEEPDRALHLLHNLLDNDPDVMPASISIRTATCSVSSEKDGYHAARGEFLYVAKNNLMGSSCIEPAEVVLSVFSRPGVWAKFTHKATTRNRLNRVRTAFTISVEPPALAM